MTQKKRGTAQRRDRRSSRGCLFWAVLAVVILSIAVAARKPLEEAFGRLFGRQKQAAPTVVVAPPAPQPVEPARPLAPPATSPSPAQPAQAPRGTKTETPVITVAPPEKPPVRKARLFFATVGEDGKILLKGVIRPIPTSDSPLRDTLQTLMAGPTSPEMNQGLLTMIPGGARLRSVTVRGDTAYVDFSESFRFSTLGREGLNAQLQQVVYAATEFPTVKRVQILIEGARVQYLGPEGIRIDAPLTRSSFKD
jgi:germination protein M